MALHPIEFWFRPFIEGPLAFVALLFAFALRHRKRIFAPTGFVLLALGLIADAVTRSVPPMPWTRFGRAAGLTLILWGLLHIAVDLYQGIAIRGRAHFSTTVADAVRATLYLAVLMLVLRLRLHFDFGVLGILSTIPAGGALISWLLRSDFIRGLLLQSQRAVRPGDWIKVDEHTGQVQWTGWRATRVLTRAHESLQIPNSLLSQHLVANYSVSGPVADEIVISLGYEEAPGKIEEAILRLLDDITEVLKKPQPTVDPLEFTDTAIRYRIRYWLSRYVLQERVRAQISRSLWYALHRSNIEILTARHSRRTSHQSAPQNWDGASRSGAEDGLGSRESIAAELRRFYLLRGLSDDELKMLTATTRVLQFGRGEVLIREGEIGESFFILTKGSVEVLESSGGAPKVVRKIEHSSAENFFGEIALLTGQPRSTTIRASTDVEVLEVTREGFVQLFKARPEAAPAIAEIAEARVAESRQRAAMVSSQMTTASSSGFLSSMRRVFDL